MRRVAIRADSKKPAEGRTRAEVNYRGGAPVAKAAGPQLMVLPRITPRVTRSNT
jgi:hypothetical protein